MKQAPTKAKPETRGRKTKLTAELIAQIETALKGHSTVAATCDLVGISEEAFYRWRREGETATSGLKREFYESQKKALGMSRIMLTSKIAADPSWQAKAWLLERMFPKEYGRRQLIAHAGADGESDLPATAQPVNLIMNFQGSVETDAPWVFRDGVDPEPHNGSDPWEADAVDWEGTPTPGLPMPEPERPLPSDPAVPTSPPGWPLGQIETKKPNPLDTGGRPRDPDEP